MTDDALRSRLADVDPASGPVDPITSPRAHELLEQTMSHDLLTPSATAPARSSRSRVVATAAAITAVAAAGVGLAVGGGTSSHPKSATTLQVQARPGISSTCIRFDVSLLKQVPTAFAGDVTDVTPTSVTLDVTHWYRGGSAQTVVLSRPDASVSLRFLGVDLAKGGHYLVAAAGGVVKGCGYTGEASGELASAYQQAFG